MCAFIIQCLCQNRMNSIIHCIKCRCSGKDYATVRDIISEKGRTVWERNEGKRRKHGRKERKGKWEDSGMVI